jgi:hypothetical protein
LSYQSLPSKNAEEIAALVDVERLVMQAFIGTTPWDHRPLVNVLVTQVVNRLTIQNISEALFGWRWHQWRKRTA